MLKKFWLRFGERDLIGIRTEWTNGVERFYLGDVINGSAQGPLMHSQRFLDES